MNGGNRVHIEIRKLTPDLVEDYVHFFDTTPHADNKSEHRCYCVWWCNDDYEGKDLTSSPEKRRDYAIQCVKGDNIQGYLAYCDDEVVGWCNANTKMDCLKCYSWRRFMGSVPTEESTPDIKVKSIFCFAISPKMRRRGIASRFVERVCLDAADDGFDFVEAYPNKEFIDEAEDCMGPFALYKKSGFSEYYETEENLVMRKQLK
jgi:ribosomal protein S18 acetylase RimI-like enzyme